VHTLIHGRPPIRSGDKQHMLVQTGQIKEAQRRQIKRNGEVQFYVEAEQWKQHVIAVKRRFDTKRDKTKTNQRAATNKQ
jgi:hypothetical protein